MSLELLKEKFGHSGVIKKSDNREKIQEKLKMVCSQNTLGIT